MPIIHKISHEINTDFARYVKNHRKNNFLNFFYRIKILSLFTMHLYSHRSVSRDVEAHETKVYPNNLILDRSFLVHFHYKIALPHKRKICLKCFYLKNVDIRYPYNWKPYICVFCLLRVNRSCAFRKIYWPKHMCGRHDILYIFQDFIILFYTLTNFRCLVWTKQLLIWRVVPHEDVR